MESRRAARLREEVKRPRATCERGLESRRRYRARRDDVPVCQGRPRAHPRPGGTPAVASSPLGLELPPPPTAADAMRRACWLPIFPPHVHASGVARRRTDEVATAGHARGCGGGGSTRRGVHKSCTRPSQRHPKDGISSSAARAFETRGFKIPRPTGEASVRVVEPSGQIFNAGARADLAPRSRPLSPPRAMCSLYPLLLSTRV